MKSQSMSYVFESEFKIYGQNGQDIVQLTSIKPNFQSAEFSERAEFKTIKSCSAVTIYSISERHFLPRTIEFPPARKIPLTGNQPLHYN